MTNMHVVRYGDPDALPQSKVSCPLDEFENAIRKIGVVTACEYFGYRSDDTFVSETIDVLKGRAK